MKYKIFVTVFIGGLVAIFCVGNYTMYRDKKIKASPPRYVYETYSKAANAVVFIERLKFKDEYIEYYKRVKKGETPSFNFPLRTFPTNDPVYILGYTSDSLLVKVVSYYDRGPWFGGSYNEGYVISEALHVDPPARQ